MPEIETLAKILNEIAKQPWDHALFVEGNCPWREDARCAVLNPDDSDDPDEDPPFAKESGLKYALNVQQARSVVENLRQQMPQAGPSDLTDAFNFYAKNDAFIRVGASGMR
ncbi:MAG TPA: hypothetical protein VKB88_11595 [Bryobacteraceae bacterium]|nr:hypothetical protein [Bryobacteraceae bacterium]